MIILIGSPIPEINNIINGSYTYTLLIILSNASTNKNKARAQIIKRFPKAPNN